jgi:hypothetical protein
MASLARCSSCDGFVPTGVGSCPNCGASAGLAGRIGFLLKAAGGASVAMTLMACYGVPYEPNDSTDTDTDPTEGTVSTGETESSSGSSSGGAESTGAADSSGSSTGGSTGGSESGGSESAGSESGSESGGDSSTGAGAVDEPPLPRRAG